MKQRQGKHEDALSWLEKAAAVDRENAYTQFLLGDVLLDLKRKEEARAHIWPGRWNSIPPP
jgi:Flp pilus assembly protein TadD